MRIKTKVNKKSIKVRDYFPANDPIERKTFKYYCPICLRYFNTLLVSSCCDNYICRFCIGDIAKKAKSNPDFLIMCSHCTQTNYRLTDVDPKAPLKIYTDTPLKAKTYETVNITGIESPSTPSINKNTNSSHKLTNQTTFTSCESSKQNYQTPAKKGNL